ncbi:MAG: glycoside hydrolase [Ignavibacteriae bacterium]|nr:glycoside hydrolase [Ignavibacteriota bacterium]
MSVSKKYLKSKPICKVTFRIPVETGRDYKTASLVGDFNNWDHKANRMKKLVKDGSFSIVVNLEKDAEYQFRYLLDGNEWANEIEAEKHITTHFGDSQNSIIVL